MTPRGLSIVAGTCAALGILGLAAYAAPYTVDDAYVVARLARHLAGGHDLVMNVGGPRVDGVTEPLWLLPMALGEALGAGGVVVSKVFGVLAAMLAAYRGTVFVTERVSRPAALLATLAAIAPSMAVAAVSGLGTALAAWLLTEAIVAALYRPAPKAWRASAMLFLLAFTRPELAVAALVVGTSTLVRERRSGIVVLGGAALGGACVVAYRLVLFGHPVPLAALAKPPELEHGLGYVLPGLVATGMGFVLAAAALRGPELSAEAKMLVALAAAHVAAIVLAGGDWMPAYRLFAPLLPTSAALLGFVVDARVHDSRVRRVASALGIALACLLPWADGAANLPRAHASSAVRAGAGRRLATALSSHCRRVALVDVGYLGYASGVEIVDLAGLVDADVARLRGGHLDKAIEPAWLALRDPDCLLLHSGAPPRISTDGVLEAIAGYPVERRVAGMAFVRADYRVASTVHYGDDPFYEYVLLVRLPP